MRSLKSIIPFRRSAQDKRKFLLNYMKDGDIGAEIGVWKGDFSEMVLKEKKLSAFYLIDPWCFQPEFKNRMYGGKVAKSQVDMDQIYEGVKERLSSFRNLTYIRKKSDEAAKEIKNGSLDWVYIDGNHYREYVKKDLELFFHKVKVSGYLIGDDILWKTEEGKQEVFQAVSEFVATHYQVARLVDIQENQFVISKMGEITK